MSKWILTAALLGGCALPLPNAHGSDGRSIWAGEAAIAAAIVVAVIPSQQESGPYCSDPDPSPPHTCPSSNPKAQ